MQQAIDTDTFETLKALSRSTLVEVHKIALPKESMGRNISKDELLNKIMYEARAEAVHQAIEKVSAAEQAKNAVVSGVAVSAAVAANSDSGLDEQAKTLVATLRALSAGSVDESKVRAIVSEEFAAKSEALKALVDEAVASMKPRIEKIVVNAATGEERKVEGHVHAVFDKVCKLASIRQNVLLVGPAGSGKTQLASQVADALKLPFTALSCSAGMSESHFTGWLIPIGEGGKFVHVPADVLVKYEAGGVILLDEIDAADENVLVFWNRALANGGFFLPQRHENPWVKRHQDCAIIAAANTYGHGADMMYSGRNRLDGATLDRFRAGIVTMDYDADLEEALIDAAVLDWGRAIRKKIDGLKLRRVLSTRVMLDFTKQKALLGYGVKEWDQSYFADWTRDELSKVGR